MKINSRVSYLLFFGIFIFFALYDMIFYEFTEQFTAAEIVFNKLRIEVILVAIVFSGLIIRYGYKKGKIVKSKVIDYFKATGLFIISVFGIALLTFALFQGSILTSNRIFGTQKDILLNGTIIKFDEMNSRGKVHYYIKVKDSKFNRDISLRVKNKYKVGDSFTMDMKIGCLGLLYKK